MTRGLYLSTAGMIAQERRVDALANNLANANTPGYQRDVPAVQSFHWLLSEATASSAPGASPATPAAAPAPKQPAGAAAAPLQPMEQLPVPREALDPQVGPLQRTDNPLDMALEGDAFFEVTGPAGTRYTRAGNFSRDRDGYLVTATGDKVQGQGGDILAKGTRLDVSLDGGVFVDGRKVDTLKLLSLPASQMTKVGGTQFTATGAQPAGAGVRVVQGSLRMSNVNTVQEMASLMVATRAYETGQKVLQMQDQTLDKAANEVGRV